MLKVNPSMEEQNTSKTKRRKPWLAALLNLICAGTGQIYNGEIQKGIFVYSLWWAISLSIAYFRLFHSFKGLIVALALLGFFLIAITVEAFISASRKKDYHLKAYNKVFIYFLPYLLSVLVSLSLSMVQKSPYPNALYGIQSFRIPSASMTPTLQPGDTLMSDLHYFKNHPAQRGDLAVFPNPNKPELEYIKRIVALEGDSVKIQNGNLYVNEEIIENRNKSSDLGSPYEDSPAQIIPSGKAFMVGDNLNSSVDSREWGSVDLNTFIAKPLYIYYSPDKNRIGKQLH